MRVRRSLRLKLATTFALAGMVLVLMTHVTREGEPKLVERCTYPLTGRGVVTRVYTDLAVVEPGPDGLRLVELAPGVGFDEVQRQTGAPLHFEP